MRGKDRPSSRFSSLGEREEKRLALLRVIAAITTGLVCLWLIWGAGRAGLSRLISYQSMALGSLMLVNKAVNLSPSDPEAYYTRALILEGQGKHGEMVKEIERSIARRPGDYFLWLELGRARDQADDGEGALAAFEEAIRLAPYYAEPRWQLGNLLLRGGRFDEAFAQLRRAAASDPNLLPALIELAWGTYGGEARVVQQAIEPQSTATRLALARFFAEHEDVAEANDLWRAAGADAGEDRRAFVGKLIASNRFTQAYEVWSSGREVAADDSAGRGDGGAAHIGYLTDGSFEGEVDLDDSGFGWHRHNQPAVRVSLDPHESRAGTQSLLINWSGNSDPSAPVISQLVMVEPSRRYRLSFAARTEGIVTGGLPIVVLVDASSGRALAQSAPLPPGTGGWRDYSLEFTTGGGERQEAVRLIITRQNCSSSPCPIFGQAWWDAFSLQKLL